MSVLAPMRHTQKAGSWCGDSYLIFVLPIVKIRKLAPNDYLISKKISKIIDKLEKTDKMSVSHPCSRSNRTFGIFVVLN